MDARTTEKIGLMRELGMDSRALALEQHGKFVDQVAPRLVEAGLKLTTDAEVQERLRFYYFDWQKIRHDANLWILGFMASVMWVLAVVAHRAGSAHASAFGVFVGCVLALVASVIAAATGIKRTQTEWVELAWYRRSEVPLEALRAVKAAKNLGVGHFRVYFPVREGGSCNDPIITGSIDDYVVEVFAWDERELPS